MIAQLFRIQFLRLWHSKSDLVLTFVVPLAFFSVFAMIFGSPRGGGSTPKINVAVCDSVRGQSSSLAIERIRETASLRFHQSDSKQDSPSIELFSQAKVTDLVRRGIVHVGIVFHRDQVQILADSYDQVASQVTAALVQKAVLATIAPDPLRVPSSGDGVQLSLHQDASPAFDKTLLASNLTSTSSLTAPMFGKPNNASSLASIPSFEIVDILGGKKSNPAVSMYAAGIAVMFLLFSMTTAGGSLLDERENGTFERLMTTQLTIDQLLMGKWLYMVTLGSIQVTLMFIWGQVVFSVELFRHWDGFVAMTLVTVGAATSFALMLAAACRSRSQLNWISVVIILAMSALGGSMVPRYLMAPSIQAAGQWTFNAWALEGYNKVFWRDLPVRDLTLELGVLTLCGFVFIVLARLLIRSWEPA